MIRQLRNFAMAMPRLLTLDRRVDEMKMNQGLLLSEMARLRHSTQLRDYEFKVFSQWGEDGIIQFLTQRLPIKNRTFIEFGVEDFLESNCRFLLMKDLWHGFVIDGSQKNINRLRNSYFYWRYPLNSKAAFITRENVADLLAESGFDKEVGILSVDVDGMDYHLLEQLSEWKASVVIVEYNSLYGSHRRVTVPYSPSFDRRQAHWSHLYWGASLGAFAGLLASRGYALVGVNSQGSNAFFVRRELLNSAVVECRVEECFRESTFREGRNPDGTLSFRLAVEQSSAIASMPLLDLETQRQISVADLSRGPQ